MEKRLWTVFLVPSGPTDIQMFCLPAAYSSPIGKRVPYVLACQLVNVRPGGGNIWIFAGPDGIKNTALYVMEMRYLRSMCGIMCKDQVRNEKMWRRTGATRVGWRAVCVEVVWTCGKNGGGLVGEENSGIRCKVERKAMNGTDDGKRTLNERNVCRARKDDCIWQNWMESSGECMNKYIALVKEEVPERGRGSWVWNGRGKLAFAITKVISCPTVWITPYWGWEDWLLLKGPGA